MAVLGLVAAGCGRNDSTEEASALLERGLSADVSSGVLDLEAEADLRGLEGLEEPIRLDMEGPFGNYTLETPPELDWDFDVDAGQLAFTGRLVTTADNAWVEVDGNAYEVGAEPWADLIEETYRGDGPKTFQEAGVEPMDWVRDAEVDGQEDVGGEPTDRVTARVDLPELVKGFVEFIPADEREGLPSDSEADELGDVVEDPELTAWIGEDGIWRRLEIELSFDVPEDQRDEVGGLESGDLSLRMKLGEPNEEQAVDVPTESRPFTELFDALGIPPELFLGPGFQVPKPG